MVWFIIVQDKAFFFQPKNPDIYLFFCENICFGYSLEVPQ